MGAREGVEPVNLVPFSFKEFRGTKNPPHSMGGERQCEFRIRHEEFRIITPSMNRGA
ncbi:MAG: hypothetical protein ACFB2X_14865 [Rivularia sp. (in: cyanobacteria)]